MTEEGAAAVSEVRVKKKKAFSDSEQPRLGHIEELDDEMETVNEPKEIDMKKRLVDKDKASNRKQRKPLDGE